MRYTEQNRRLFYEKLVAYRTALESGSSREIIETSLAVHAASGLVSQASRRLVGRTFRETERTVPLDREAVEHGG